MSTDSATAGLAALSIAESILLSLVGNGLIKEAEATAILADAAAAHHEAARLDGAPGLHQETAALIQSIIDHGNSVKRVRLGDVSTTAGPNGA